MRDDPRLHADYAAIKARLERDHAGEYVVIAEGRYDVFPTFDEAREAASLLSGAYLIQCIGQQVPNLDALFTNDTSGPHH